MGCRVADDRQMVPEVERRHEVGLAAFSVGAIATERVATRSGAARRRDRAECPREAGRSCPRSPDAGLPANAVSVAAAAAPVLPARTSAAASRRAGGSGHRPRHRRRDSPATGASSAAGACTSSGGRLQISRSGRRPRPPAWRRRPANCRRGWHELRGQSQHIGADLRPETAARAAAQQQHAAYLSAQLLQPVGHVAHGEGAPFEHRPGQMRRGRGTASVRRNSRGPTRSTPAPWRR